MKRLNDDHAPQLARTRRFLPLAALITIVATPAFAQRGVGGARGAGGGAPVLGSIQSQLSGGISGTPYATSGGAGFGTFSPYNGAIQVGEGGGGVGYGGVGYGGVGYGGYGNYGGGYGNYGGGYGGFGYSGYGGYGGYGYGNAYGGGYGYGITPYTAAIAEREQIQQSNARYNLLNAESVEAYQGANLMRAEAYDALTDAQVQRRKAMSNGSDGSDAIPIQELFSREGDVLWPLGAPTDGDLGAKKDAASEAVKKVVTEFLADREAPTREVINARQALSDYAVPAAKYFEKTEDKQDEKDWEKWVTTLDQGLRTMAGIERGPADEARPNPRRAENRPKAKDEPAPELARPAGQPKSAGDVLRDSLRSRSSEQTKPAPASTPTPPDPAETPKSDPKPSTIR